MTKLILAKLLAALILFTAVMSVHVLATTIPVKDVIALGNDAGTRKILDILDGTAQTIADGLRKPVDSKGNLKDKARMDADNNTAERILAIAKHPNTKLLMALVGDAYEKDPNTDMENVIGRYLHRELDRQTKKAQDDKH